MQTLRGIIFVLLAAICMITTFINFYSDVVIVNAFRTDRDTVKRDLTSLQNINTLESNYNLAVIFMAIAEKTDNLKYKKELYRESNRILKSIKKVAGGYWDVKKNVDKTEMELKAL